MSESDLILSVEDLRVQFRTDHGWVTAVDGLSYELRKGETLGIVGESGSGKSVTNLAVLQLLDSRASRVTGKVMFQGKDLLGFKEKQMQKIRGNKISMIFQDPMTSLNPFLRIGTQLVEVLELHQSKLTKKQMIERVIDMLEKVGIPGAANRWRDYPHQFSGGMRQRVMIAMMLLNSPELLIADEPTTALDVTIQAQILDLLKSLQREFETSITLITHDLGVVAGMSDKIMVMYSGKVMESATADDLFERPSHPYTVGLLKSIPRLGEDSGERLYSIPGIPPDLHRRPPGCPFAPRCSYAKDHCNDGFPPATEVSPGHVVHCFETERVQRDVAEGQVKEVAQA